MFYMPTHCGGCSRHIDNIPDWTFGDQLVPYHVTRSQSQEGFSLDSAVTMYLCNSCTGIVARDQRLKLVLAVQYRITLTSVPKVRRHKAAEQAQMYGANIHYMAFDDVDQPHVEYKTRAHNDLSDAIAYAYRQQRQPGMTQEEFQRRILELLRGKQP